jgi:DNA-directed RNA polymerase subunit RPC12/RpoP
MEGRVVAEAMEVEQRCKHCGAKLFRLRGGLRSFGPDIYVCRHCWRVKEKGE